MKIKRSKKAILAILAMSGAISVGFLLSQPQDAMAKYGRKGKNTQTPAEAHFYEGTARMRARDFDGAIDSFLQAVYFARNGFYPEAHYWLGICYKEKYKDDKAIASLKVATNTSVEPLPDAFIAMAEIHLRNERFEEAEEAVGGARMAGAPYEKQYYLEGLIAENKKEYQTAEAYFVSALGEKPWKWTSAWMHLAECKMKQKKWLESLREFNELLKTDQPLKNEPFDRIYSDMGVCALAIGDHQGALDNWHRSLDYDNTNPETHINLGMMLESEKHYSAAIKEYKEAIKYLIERKPNDPRIQQLRNRIIKLEQMIKPSEMAPQRAKPSPYMRKKDEEQEEYSPNPGQIPGKGNVHQGDSGF